MRKWIIDTDGGGDRPIRVKRSVQNTAAARLISSTPSVMKR